MNSLHVQNISAGYGKKTVIESVSFKADQGKVIGIVGPNGCGKSTLIKSICCILPHTGNAGFDEPFESLTEKSLSKICSYLPQHSGITMNLPVMEVVLMAFNPVLDTFSSPTEEMIRKAKELLELVGLKGKEQTGFLNLSGGEKQLCLLARTLVLENKLLLLDEPENSLDPMVRIKVMKTVKEAVNKNNSVAIASLHDINLALNMCDQVLLIKAGKVYSILKPESESVQSIESKLTEIYGMVSVKEVFNKSGNRQLVMLSEI